jgi:hypothetical protein
MAGVRKNGATKHLLAAASTLPPLALAALWEAFVRYPLPLLVYAVYGGLSVTVLFFLWRPISLRAAVAVPLVIGLFVMYAVPWTSRKAFVRDLHKIKPGMSVSQADTIMSHYIFGSGWPFCPSPASEPASALQVPLGCELAEGLPRPPPPPEGEQRIYRHSDDPAFDSDWGIVSIQDGHVVRVEFSAD